MHFLLLINYWQITLWFESFIYHFFYHVYDIKKLEKFSKVYVQVGKFPQYVNIYSTDEYPNNLLAGCLFVRLYVYTAVI